MSKNNSETIHPSYPKSGIIPFRLTSDLVFHYLMQNKEHPNILKGVVSAFFEIPIENIKSAEVGNPISYGDNVTSKEMILDVKALLNDDKIVNLEMQVVNHYDWPERSLSYLCRCFDNLKIGQGYLSVKGVYHIGFLDYTLFPENPEFYATYTIRNDKTNEPYTSKFKLSVLDLTLIDNATKEDIQHHRKLWASFFKTTTWEEVYMLAQQDSNISEATKAFHRLIEEQKFQDQYWAREDYIRQQIDLETHWKNEVATRDAEIAALKAQLACMKQNQTK